MEKFKQLQKIKDIYSRNENIIQYLKSISHNDSNSIEDILISYDFQAGTYINNFSKNKEYYINYTKALAEIINNLTTYDSILEVGVGEATTLSSVIRSLTIRPSKIMGFDISWSRLKFGSNLLNDYNIDDVNLFTANLFEIPLLDNSVDIVYTSHSLEPNGGREEEALRELYRITKKYLILLEPSSEFSSMEAKSRMKKHGYVMDLYKVAKRLNYKIIEHRLFDYYSNPLNPTGLIIIEKNENTQDFPKLVCPITRTELIEVEGNMLYSKQSFLAYPKLGGIPCLLKENSILATHLLTDYAVFKKSNNITLK